MLKDKHCLILGATGGIGREVVKVMHEAGCIVRELNSHDYDFRQNIDLLISLLDEWKPRRVIDIIINCAGVYAPGNEGFDTMMNVNVRTAWLFARACAPSMIERCWGRIVNIGSSSAYAGNGNTPLYCASKHALLGLSRSLDDAWKQYNVRTYCISPDGVDTPMGRRIPGIDPDTLIDPKDVARYILDTISYDGNMVVPEVRLRRKDA